MRSLFENDRFETQLRDIDRSLQDLRDDVDIAERESMCPQLRCTIVSNSNNGFGNCVKNSYESESSMATRYFVISDFLKYTMVGGQ